MLKRLFAQIIALLILLSLTASEAESTENVEALRSFLQVHYEITIFIGDECLAVPTDGFEARLTSQSVFQKMLDGNKRFEGMLMLLDDVLSLYPPGFCGHFEKDLRFLFADEIVKDGMFMGGMYTIDTFEGLSNIFLSKRDSADRAIHHEIWHAMEYRILCESPDAFAAWSTLNPDGFEYKLDYTSASEEEMDDWFAREYSKINEAEDRATVFDSIMVKDPQWWQTRPHLLQKARFLLDAAKPVFGEMFPGT